MMAPAVLLALLLQAAPVQWRISAPESRSVVKAGGKVAVTLVATIAPGWHLYSLKKVEGGPIPTSIVLRPDQVFHLAGAIDATPPVSRFDDTIQMDVESYEESAEFVLPVEVAKAAKVGIAWLNVAVRFQVCDDKQCLPPRAVIFEIWLEVK